MCDLLKLRASLNSLSPLSYVHDRAILLGSLDRFVEQRTQMFKVVIFANGNLQKVSHQMQKKKKILAGKSGVPNGRDDLPSFRGHWELETAR